jgi:hypothetical protein
MVMLDDSRKQNNPLRLTGLRQAIYILNKLKLGMGKSEIIKDFKGDEQLVNIWLSFLLHNHWIEQEELGQLVATEKGKQWAKRLLTESSEAS